MTSRSSLKEINLKDPSEGHNSSTLSRRASPRARRPALPSPSPPPSVRPRTSKRGSPESHGKEAEFGDEDNEENKENEMQAKEKDIKNHFKETALPSVVIKSHQDILCLGPVGTPRGAHMPYYPGDQTLPSNTICHRTSCSSATPTPEWCMVGH